VVIKDFLGEDALIEKLSAMGLRKGAEFTVKQRCGRNLLIQNGTNRLIISKELAEKVLVEIIKKEERPCEEISCEILKSECPEEGPLPKRKTPHRHRKRKGLLYRLCPFLKD
jgi:ferrous iron transport protein A